jgi:signal transduction histidine kinase
MNSFDDITVVIVIGTLLLITIAAFIVSFIFIYRARQRQHLQEKQQLYGRFQEELLRTQLEIQEQTFQNISQEIHDNIGQSLSLAKLNLNTVDLQKADAAMQKIINTKELVSKAIYDLRDISRSLNADSRLSSGLLKAVEQELSLIEKAGVFETEFIVTGKPVTMDRKKEFILFRILQEAMNNAIKHSQAKKIVIRAIFSESTVTMEVENDGPGFSTSQITDGSGLRNMRSRVELLGGEFNIKSGSSGTVVQLTIPRTTT